MAGNPTAHCPPCNLASLNPGLPTETERPKRPALDAALLATTSNRGQSHEHADTTHSRKR